MIEVHNSDKPEKKEGRVTCEDHASAGNTVTRPGAIEARPIGLNPADLCDP